MKNFGKIDCAQRVKKMLKTVLKIVHSNPWKRLGNYNLRR
jgi:hypothetical protein